MGLNRFVTGALTSGFLALSAPTAAISQDNTIRLNMRGAQENPSTAIKTTYVDTSDIIVVDVSISMDDQEIKAAFEGAAEYYLSERNLSNYRMGICAQSTIIYFGKEAQIGPSAIICSEEDARAFSDTILSENTLWVRYMVNPARSYTGNGMYAALDFFEQQLAKGEITPLQYRVVLIGDELQLVTQKPVKKASKELVQKFDAQIFGIAIGSAKVQARFDQYMASDVVNFPSALAFKPQGVSYNLNEFLRFTTG